MLRSRLIANLSFNKKKELIKTIKFQDRIYIGDIINAVRILNEKEVDELIITDLDATSNCLSPDFDFIEKISKECRMPLCYSGGIKNIDQIKKILNIGIEKVSISSTFFQNESIVSQIVDTIGSQSLVLTLDLKYNSLNKIYEIFTNNGKKKEDILNEKFLKKISCLDIGELVLNSIDRDGTMTGIDEGLFFVREKVNMPLTLLGGCSSLENVKNIFEQNRSISIACGSIFIFKGSKKAVLINYPDKDKKNSLHLIKI